MLFEAVHFTSSITLGAVLIAAVAGFFGLFRLALGVNLRSTNEVLGKRIVALEGDIADKDRRLEVGKLRLHELGAEKDKALAEAAACFATVETLKEQIAAMPKYEDVIRFGTEQMAQVNKAAQERQESFVKVVTSELKKHDEHVEQIHQESETRATERHAQQTEINNSILKALSRIMQNTGGNR